MTTEIEEGATASDEDIDAMLADTWAEIQSRDDENETDDQKTERLRDESGKFAKAEETTTDGLPEPISVKVPSSFKKEFQERFSELTPEWQSELQRREDDFHKGIEGYKQKAQIVDQFEPIAEHIHYLKDTYGDPIQPIGELVKLDKFANTDPVGFIKWFAQSKGIPLDGTGVQDMQSNPVLSALQNEVQQLRGFVQGEQQTRQQQAHNEALQAIEAFAASPDAVHFEDLRPQIAQLLASGVATDLKSAHEMALWSRPDLRQSLISQQIAAEQEKAKQEAKQRSESAKKAASVNVSKRGHVPNKAADEDPDEIIAREAARLGFI